MNMMRKILRARPMQYVLIAVIACFSALSFELFVSPNGFAPAGVNGIATMVQYKLNFSLGYMSLLINLPMLAVAAFILDRAYAFRTLTFVVVFSGAVLFLQGIGIESVVFHGMDGGSRLMAAIAAGFFTGLFYSLSIRLGGSTGGTDIVGAFIHRKYPAYDTVAIIFTLNASVAVLSFFVYDFTYEPVILCIVYSFVSNRVSDAILKGTRSAARFEVVTPYGVELSSELMETLHHGVTLLPAKGMYSNSDYSVLICIVNRRQVVEFEKILLKYDKTFASISTANGVVGRFKHVK